MAEGGLLFAQPGSRSPGALGPRRHGFLGERKGTVTGWARGSRKVSGDQEEEQRRPQGPRQDTGRGRTGEAQHVLLGWGWRGKSRGEVRSSGQRPRGKDCEGREPKMELRDVKPEVGWRG